jgi:hypothetical protein
MVANPSLDTVNEVVVIKSEADWFRILIASPEFVMLL